MAMPARLVEPPTERLTWAQICARHPREWVALIEVDWIDESSFCFRSAVVIGHGPRRRDPLAQIRALRERHLEMAHCFTGPVTRC